MPPKRTALAKISPNVPPQQSSEAKKARKVAVFNASLNGKWHLTHSTTDEGRGIHSGLEATCKDKACRLSSAIWQADPTTAIDLSKANPPECFWGPDETKAMREALRDSDGEEDKADQQGKGKGKKKITAQPKSSERGKASSSNTPMLAPKVSNAEKIARYNATVSGDTHESRTSRCSGPEAQCKNPTCKSASLSIQCDAFEIQGVLNEAKRLAQVERNSKGPSHMFYDGSIHRGLESKCKNVRCKAIVALPRMPFLTSIAPAELENLNVRSEPECHYTAQLEIHSGSLSDCMEPMCKHQIIQNKHGKYSKESKAEAAAILAHGSFHFAASEDVHRGPANLCTCRLEFFNRFNEGNDIGEVDAADSNDSVASFYITETPTKIRGKIKRLIDNKGMGVMEFCNAINVSSRSYYRFMKQKGNSGQLSDVYAKAFRFFQKREAKGIPIPKKATKRKLDTALEPTPASGPTTKKARGSSGPKGAATTTATATTKATSAFDVSAIRLDGDDTDTVPIFDSCDEIRRKITAHLKKPDVVQAQFLRDLHAQLRSATRPKSIQSKALTDFRAKKGATAGSTSSVYYAAYVFFEKLRVLQGKPKSEHRQDVEECRPEGFDTVTRSWNRPFVVSASTRGIAEDEFGFFTSY